MSKTRELSSLEENIAAISASFHTDKRYEQFYRDLGPSLGGFPGIWSFCAVAAKVFTQVETERGMGRWESGDWIDTVDAYVDAIYFAASPAETEEFLRPLAEQVMPKADGEQAPAAEAADKEVVVHVSGGVVQDVEVPDGVRVVVKDYDVEGCEPDDDRIKSDDDGEYHEAVYEN